MNTQTISSLPDEEVLSLTDLHLPPEQEQRLIDLFCKQQVFQLTNAENIELTELGQAYQVFVLQKVQALREAIQRGLRKPLDF
jgi:hypothetical protein